MVTPCGFESHLSHQSSPNPIRDLGMIFLQEIVLEGPLKNVPVAYFQAVGDSMPYTCKTGNPDKDLKL